MPCKRNCNDCCECLSPIPNGGTCEIACRHIAKCKAIFGQKGHETCCQWVPSRFSPRIERAAEALARAIGFPVQTACAAINNVLTEASSSA